MKFYNKPYPLNKDLKYNAKIVFFISLGILCILLLFQPLNLHNLGGKDLFYLATGIAASTFLSLALNLLILPSLFPKLFEQNKWKVKYEIIWNIWIVSTIMISNFLFYTKLFGFFDIDLATIGKFILIAIIPVSVLITINQDRLLRTNLRIAESLNKKLSETGKLNDELITFNSEYKNDSLILKSSALLLIRSANNYIEVFYLENGETKKQMIRCSISNTEKTLKDFSFILRCHRKYIVNVNHIVKIEGNSQGYNIALEGLDFPVMVSQKYIRSFKKVI